ncbi:hypothetical protein WAI56_20075, partial [Acinetobacter baumannii]
QNTQELTKILIRLSHLLQKNGRKSHRYEKKTKESCIMKKISLKKLLWHTYFLKDYKHLAISN